jgi:hypothetical protein
LKRIALVFSKNGKGGDCGHSDNLIDNISLLHYKNGGGAAHIMLKYLLFIVEQIILKSERYVICDIHLTKHTPRQEKNGFGSILSIVYMQKIQAEHCFLYSILLNIIRIITRLNLFSLETKNIFYLGNRFSHYIIAMAELKLLLVLHSQMGIIF